MVRAMADDKPSHDDEPAPVAAAEKPGATKKKVSKKKASKKKASKKKASKKKASKKKASAASGAEPASKADEPARKKKTKKKKRPASSATSSPTTARPRSERADGRGAKGDDDNTLALGIGAVVVAVLAVGVVWWMKNDGSDATESLEAVDTAVSDTAQADPAAPPEEGQPPVQPPGPQPIPAPEDVAAPPEGAERTESGIASRVLEPGEGTEHPGPRDRVTVHYTGWTTDGEMFDSSIRRGRPATFPLDGVIPGWTEGVQLMVQGEKRRFWIPANLAYEGRRPCGSFLGTPKEGKRRAQLPGYPS